MAKYSKDLDETYVQKVKNLSMQFGLKEMGVQVEAIALLKGKVYGEVKTANDLMKLFTGKEDVVAVAINEELFDRLDDGTQDILIENLLEQIKVDEDKEGNLKIKIEKPQICLGIQTYRKYGNVATQSLEASLLTIDQIAEQEAEQKELLKAEKKQNKGKY